MNEAALMLAALAETLDATLEGDGDVEIRGVQTLADATARDVTFVIDEARATQWPASRGAAVIVATDFDALPDDPRPVLRVKNVDLAVAALLERFAPPPPRPETGVHPAAWVHPEATVASDAAIGPHVSIERGVVIGERTAVHAGARIGPDVTIGTDGDVRANATIERGCRLGDRVIVHPGAVIGADGFAYRPRADRSGLVKIPHQGTVVIEDDVEIGANTTIDRGKFGATVIRRGARIDNLVQIAHNCEIGENAVIASLVGIAGSTTIGPWVQMGGQSGAADHLTIGAGAQVGGRAAVIGDIEPGAVVLGYPARPRRDVLREWAALRKLPGFLRGRRPPSGPTPDAS